MLFKGMLTNGQSVKKADEKYFPVVHSFLCCGNIISVLLISPSPSCFSMSSHPFHFHIPTVIPAFLFIFFLLFLSSFHISLLCVIQQPSLCIYLFQKEEDGYALSEEGQQILEQTNMDQLVQQSTDYTHMLHALGRLFRVSTLSTTAN